MSAASTKGNVLVFGAEPRADLLPPEVHERARALSTRKSLGALVVLALVIAVGAVGAAFVYAGLAEAQLAAAQQRTEALLNEQLTYAEATRVASLVELTKSAQTLAVSSEIEWPELIEEIHGYLPAGTTIESAEMQSTLPWGDTGVLEPPGPLNAPRVATVRLILHSEVLVDTTLLVRELSRLEGFADATPELVERNDTVFATTVTLNLNEDALRERFPAETEATN